MLGLWIRARLLVVLHPKLLLRSETLCGIWALRSFRMATTVRSLFPHFFLKCCLLTKSGVFRLSELKCTRRSKKKTMALSGLGFSTGSGHSTLSAGPAASGSIDRRTGLPSSPSISSALTTSSPATTLRSFFGRKGSATPVNTSPLHQSTPTFPSPALSSTGGHDDLDILGSPLAPSTSIFTSAPQQPLPVYGDASSTDAGDEVRFSCEITRVRHLQGLYYLDCKRLKGGAWSYKFIYDQLMKQLEMGEA